MPYTRNTRIKQTKWKHKQTSQAQVEYRYPFTKITEWVNFEDTTSNIFLPIEDSVARRAYIKALWNEANEDKKGEDWAKAIIDQYHKLMDDAEVVPEVTFVKYPD